MLKIDSYYYGSGLLEVENEDCMLKDYWLLRKGNRFSGKWVGVIPGKKSKPLFKSGFFFQRWRLLISRKKKFSKIHDHIPRKKVWIFFPEMTLTHFPKSDFWNFGWIFFPRMTLTHFPAFGFFFQDSRIGVNQIKIKLQISLRIWSTIFSDGKIIIVTGYIGCIISPLQCYCTRCESKVGSTVKHIKIHRSATIYNHFKMSTE